MIYNKVCKLCGIQFEAKSKRAEVCKSEHTSVCCVCGKEYVLKPPYTSKTCSLKCGQQIGNLSRKQTMLSKYGVDNPMKVNAFQAKAKETNLSKYGVDNPSKSQEVVDKISNTFRNKYGVSNAMQVKEFAEKQQDSVQQSLGVRSPLQSQQIKDKVKSTNLIRYGAENPFGSQEIRERWRAKYKKTHDYDLPIHDPEVVEKIEKTCTERYGVPYPCMTPQCRSSYRTISKINQAFMDMLYANDIEYEVEFSLSRKSFDFRILVEINPTITHNSIMSIFPDSSPTNVTYHIDKTKLAEENGYRCIHVWDWDDWNAIVSLIKPKETVYARKCTVAKVDKQTADKFTAQHHISSKCNGQKENYGLYYQGELIQVMTFGKPRYNRKYDWELLRLCSKSSLKVIGGASKLFAAYLAEHKQESVISYCDLSKFTGDVYKKIGMVLAYTTMPAKIWSKGNKKITDNLLRQRGYDQLFSTNYGKGTSNEQLMLDNGWLPVYDCGQKVYHYIPEYNLE